jgi:hypothetical protein
MTTDNNQTENRQQPTDNRQQTSDNRQQPTVTDSVIEECVDSGGNGAILNMGESGGPGPPKGEGNGQLALDSGGG